MKAQHSIGMPTRCEISAIGRMSAMTRPRGAVGGNRSRWSAISRASRSTSRTTCGPAPGSPMSAVSMPEAVDQVEDAKLLVDRRTADRRRLQPVAQRLVVRAGPSAGGGAGDAVPVVDQGMHGVKGATVLKVLRPRSRSGSPDERRSHRDDARQEDAERPGGREATASTGPRCRYVRMSTPRPRPACASAASSR